MSFTYKGDYIRSAGLKGFAMWEAGGDYEDRLLNSICKPLQLQCWFWQVKAYGPWSVNATLNGNFHPAPWISPADADSPAFRMEVFALTSVVLWILLSHALVLRDW